MTYAVFLWIDWGIQDEWVYNALDWRKPGNLLFYFGLSLLQVVVFWLMCAPTFVAAARCADVSMSAPVIILPGRRYDAGCRYAIV